jgi:hypothetical protein
MMNVHHDPVLRVFGQVYRRFLDLQKAEAQAREAQIEAALEKIRSTSLAMHHANELENVVTILLYNYLNLVFHSVVPVFLLIKEKENSALDKRLKSNACKKTSCHMMKSLKKIRLSMTCGLQ